MTVELQPETERLVQEEIKNGHVRSVDELIVYAVHLLREKHQTSPSTAPSAKLRRPEGRKSLAQLFAESPFKGLEMKFERFPDTLPTLEL